jgi:ankyrin repeat protein
MDIYPDPGYMDGDFGTDESDDDDVWVDASDPVLQNALVVALYENPDPVSMIRTLIELGVSAKRADEEGYTVLMHALDHPDVVKLLMTRDIDVDAVDLDGQTALMHACAGENSESALALIAAGADVHVVSESGETALHHALGCHLTDNLPVVRSLILAGADVNLPDASGALPLHTARLNCAGEAIIDLLERSGAVMGDAAFLD